MQTLESWHYVTEPFTRKDLKAKTKLGPKIKILGYCWDCDNFAPGDTIVTSYVKEVAMIDKSLVIKTVSGSTYKLGSVSYPHEKKFPEIAKRLYRLFNRKNMTTAIEMNDWYVDNNNTVPINGKLCLSFSYTDKEGNVVKTNPIVSSYMVNDLMLIKDTKNVCYKINNPREDYEKKFPDARNRLSVKLMEVLPRFFS